MAAEVGPCEKLGPSPSKSRVGSAFIQSLIAKYPEACKRSLTDLRGVGAAADRPKLSLPRRQHAVPDEASYLSNWSKGLSSSQPDLLDNRCLQVFGDSAPAASERRGDTGPTGEQASNLRREAASSCHDIFNSSSPASRRLLERQRDSKNKMAELAARITAISRSRQSLLNLSAEPPSNENFPRASRSRGDSGSRAARLASGSGDVSPSSSLDSDDVDDTDPASSGHAAKNSSSSSKRPAVRFQDAGSWTARDARDRLEELRVRLAEKCESLQRRKQELYARLDGRRPGSPGAAPSAVTTATSLEVAHIADLSGHPSGRNIVVTNDSDGDSGIELSLKRNPEPHENALVPKLKRYNRIRASLLQCAPSQPPATASLPELPAQSPAEPPGSPGPELSAQRPTEPMGGPVPEVDVREKVGFSDKTVVIEASTPRLQLLKSLAESAIYQPEPPSVLQDTALTRFDDDLASSGAESSDSEPSVDLSDVDPRIARLVLGFGHRKDTNTSPPPKPAPSSARDRANSTSTAQASVPSISPESSRPSGDPSETGAHPSDSFRPPKPPRVNARNQSPVRTNDPSKPNQNSSKSWTVHSTDSLVDRTAASTKADGKANAAGTANQKLASSDGDAVAHSSDEECHPYSIVDLSPFRSPRRGGPSLPPAAAKPSTKPPSGSPSGKERRAEPRAGRARSSSHSDLSGRQPGDGFPPVRGRAGSSDRLWGSNASIYSSDDGFTGSPSAGSASPSLLERVGSFKQSAKKKIRSLRRSLSLDRLHSPRSSSDSRSADPGSAPPPPNAKPDSSAKSSVPKMKKSLSWKTLNLKLAKKSPSRASKTADSPDTRPRPSPTKPMSPARAADAAAAPPAVERPGFFRPIGKVLEVLPDGSRLVQLSKPPHGPYGFYVGHDRRQSGIYVTRLSDSYPEKLFTGLLAVGDSVLAVNDTPASCMSPDRVMDVINGSAEVRLRVVSHLKELTAEEWF